MGLKMFKDTSNLTIWHVYGSIVIQFGFLVDSLSICNRRFGTTLSLAPLNPHVVAGTADNLQIQTTDLYFESNTIGTRSAPGPLCHPPFLFYAGWFPFLIIVMTPWSSGNLELL